MHITNCNINMHNKSNSSYAVEIFNSNPSSVDVKINGDLEVRGSVEINGTLIINGKRIDIAEVEDFLENFYPDVYAHWILEKDTYKIRQE